MKITLPIIDHLRSDELYHVDRNSQAREAHAALLAQMRGLLSEAQRAGRDLLASEQRQYDQAERLLDELERIVTESTVDRTGVVARPVDAGGPYSDGLPLTRAQSMTGYVQARGLVREGEERLSLQRALRGAVLGEWGGADAERRAMSESSLAGGGYLLPTPLSTSIIDMTRNATRVMQAGARIVPMENRTLDVPKWVGDPTPAWRSENELIQESGGTLALLTLTAQSLAARMVLSRELLEDAPGVDGQLRQAISAQFALMLDRVALYGSGTAPEPRGVKSTSGILTASMGANGAALGSYDPYVDAVGALRDQNEEPTAIIESTRTARSAAKLKDSTGQPLARPAYLDAIPAYATGQVPNNLTQGSSSVASDIFTADWRQLYIGVRTRLQVTVLSERWAELGQVGLIAWWRGDVAVARPKAFHVTSGVL